MCPKVTEPLEQHTKYPSAFSTPQENCYPKNINSVSIIVASSNPNVYTVMNIYIYIASSPDPVTVANRG